MRGERLRLLAALAALSVGPSAPRADDPTGGAEPPSSAATSPPGRPAFLDPVVNGVPGETTLVFVTDGGDVWVAAEDLARGGLAGLASTDGVRREHEGQTYVSLRSLEPALTYELDERTLALRIQAGPKLLRQYRLNLAQRSRPADLAPASDAGGFLNYSVLGTTERDFSGFGELGASRGPALLVTSASWLPSGGVVRGTSALTYDRVEHLQRFTLGELVGGGDALGGSVLVAGFGAAKDLSLDPYFIAGPRPSATGFASTPSVLEVWVNGNLVREIPVAPGGYELQNIPVTTGNNDVRTTLRDAFGRRQEMDSTRYLASGQLARGVTDWSYAVGAARRRFGETSFDFGRPVFLGRHRAGLSDRLTGALRLEADVDGLVSGGGTLLTSTPLGELEAGVAGSHDRDSFGAAALAAWRYATRWFATTAHVRVLSARYANASLAADAERELWRAGLSFGAPSRWGAVSVDYNAAHPRSGGLVESGGLRLSFPIARGATFFVSAGGSRGPNQPSILSAMANVSFAVGPRVTGDVGSQVQAGSGGSEVPVATAGVQRSLGAGEGYGYRLRGNADRDGSDAQGSFQLHRAFGQLEATATHTRAGETFGNATASGALALAGGRLFLTRPLYQGVALVSVPGVAGVRTYFENQLVGRTDASGHLLVPGLLPYYGHRLAIEDADVPITYGVRETQRTVATTNRGTSVVRFDVAAIRAARGTLAVPGPNGPVPPSYGTLEVELMGRRASSPVGVDGAFWLEDVPAGHHPAQITWGDGTCGFTLSVPEGASEVVDLGTIGCAAPTM